MIKAAAKAALLWRPPSARLKACPDTSKESKYERELHRSHAERPLKRKGAVSGAFLLRELKKIYFVSAKPGLAPNSRRALTVFAARAAAGGATAAAP